MVSRPAIVYGIAPVIGYNVDRLLRPAYGQQGSRRDRQPRPDIQAARLIAGCGVVNHLACSASDKASINLSLCVRLICRWDDCRRVVELTERCPSRRSNRRNPKLVSTGVYLNQAVVGTVKCRRVPSLIRRPHRVGRSVNHQLGNVQRSHPISR